MQQEQFKMIPRTHWMSGFSVVLDALLDWRRRRRRKSG